jgi:hypothetical protein
VPERQASATLAFAPVVCQQKPAAPFREPVDLEDSPPTSRLLYQAFVAKTKKISMELVATTEWQTASDLTGVVPAPVSERFEYEVLQFSALPHKRILPAFVSRPLFVMETSTRNQKDQRNGKSLHFAKKIPHASSRAIVPDTFVRKGL